MLNDQCLMFNVQCSIIKSYKPVSRILSWAIIYLSRQLLTGINLPTLYLGRATLKRYYTWHFSMQGLPSNNVTIKCRELLPRVFTFTCRNFSEGWLR
jgi:hypothetical protein